MKDPILNYFEENRFIAEPTHRHLGPSPLCDFNDPAILQLRKDLFGGETHPQKITEQVYELIRRKILYAFDAWEVSAGETLAKQSGMCFNKTNLMVALLRSAKVPAVYSLFWIRKDGFLFTSEEGMFDKIQPETVHVYCEAYLGEKEGWRPFVETSLDLKLKKVLEEKGYHPHRNILFDRPIERYATAEELLARRKEYKDSLGLKETITPEDRDLSNRKLEQLRRGGRV